MMNITTVLKQTENASDYKQNVYIMQRQLELQTLLLAASDLKNMSAEEYQHKFKCSIRLGDVVLQLDFAAAVANGLTVFFDDLLEELNQ